MSHRINRLWGLAALVSIVSLFSLTASAAESYDNCNGYIDSVPATVGTSGTWCLRKDLSTGMGSGVAIWVNANNVTIDCNDFKVGGLAAGTGTTAMGIQASDRYNVTVRNCNVRGFNAGIDIRGGGGHLVEHNRLDGNTITGIYVDGAGSKIRGNSVLDTGGSDQAHLVWSYGISARKNVDIIDNTIDGVAGGGVFGIRNIANNASIVGNRVRGLAPLYQDGQYGLAYGIYSHASYRLVLRDNILHGSLFSSSSNPMVGIHCPGNPAEYPVVADGNLVTGFQTGIENCVDAGSNLIVQ